MPNNPYELFNSQNFSETLLLCLFLTGRNLKFLKNFLSLQTHIVMSETILASGLSN